MSCKRALNFDQLNFFFENYKPMRDCQIYRISPGSFKLKRGILPLLTQYVS